MEKWNSNMKFSLGIIQMIIKERIMLNWWLKYMNYIGQGIVERFSLALRNHQITHFNDGINGMEMELLFHGWNIMSIFTYGIAYYIIE